MNEQSIINIKQINWWRTEFGEEDIAALTDAIHSGHISQGPLTARFEHRMAELLDVPYVVVTASGSISILMALMALGVGHGDEVIVPNRTWIATAHAPALLGAQVKVVDVLSEAPVMDVSHLRSLITPKTKVIIPVPLNGRAVNMEEVWKIADEYGLAVIEDAAQGLFSKCAGKYMGTESDAGCFSLSIAKIIPAGQGGFVITRREDIYKNLVRIRTHGADNMVDCEFHQMGFNFRMTDLQAAVANVQLDHVQERIQNLKEVYAKYEEALKDIPFLKFIPVNIQSGEIPIYIEVLCKERSKLVSYLAKKGIQSRPIYPNLETAKHLNISGEFPNAKIFGEQMLVLPCGPGQSHENIDYVIDALKSFGKHI